MSKGEKIIAEIYHECDEKIAAINKENDAVCNEILENAGKKAKEITENARFLIEEQSAKLLKAHQSKSELEKRNMLLKTRREEIDKAVEHILDYMENLPVKVYFELIYSLAGHSELKEGMVYFNSKDLKRLPKNLAERFAEKGISITIADTPNDTIEGGCILKNGDIEENMSFSAVIAQRHEEIEDLISKELFK